MKTYIVIVNDTDAAYVEELLRAVPRSCREGVEIHESKPLPKRRRSSKPKPAAQTDRQEELI